MAATSDTPPPVAPQELIDEAYGPAVLRAMDIIGREDFYGIVAGCGMRFFGGRMGLSPGSHVLELGSGIGGPARYFASTYGCRVTGIDLSTFNHATAVERTRAAGLGHLATFQHGDALAVALPEGAFTHVFGCEAWCYFPDKADAYARAWRFLTPGGRVAFLEAACEKPLHLRTAELLGPVHYESLSRYGDLLAHAGFVDIQRFDTTELASRDISASLFRLISNRAAVIAASDEEVYFGLLELWAEFLACFVEGRMTHCGFIATKPLADS
jgi:ubiquinone/menaquinone biosynthesis C-methylase UbiE